MREKRPSYSDLVHQVVREAPEPITFAELLERVNALQTVNWKNPAGAIRTAINDSQLMVRTGDGRLGCKYRLINDSVLRLSLSQMELAERHLSYSDEARDALWPAFFAHIKYDDRAPVHLRLPNGATTQLPLEHLGESEWGTRSSPEVSLWLESLGARAGDALILQVLDGEARSYAVELEPHTARDESAIAARNRQISQAAMAYNRHQNRAICDIASHLLATGQYKHPVPPDPLGQLLEQMGLKKGM